MAEPKTKIRDGHAVQVGQNSQGETSYSVSSHVFPVSENNRVIANVQLQDPLSTEKGRPSFVHSVEVNLSTVSDDMLALMVGRSLPQLGKIIREEIFYTEPNEDGRVVLDFSGYEPSDLFPKSTRETVAEKVDKALTEQRQELLAGTIALLVKAGIAESEAASMAKAQLGL